MKVILRILCGIFFCLACSAHAGTSINASIISGISSPYHAGQILLLASTYPGDGHSTTNKTFNFIKHP